MKTPKKNLGEAELEIMQVLWGNAEPMTSSHILKQLQGKRRWQLSTLMTALSRLADKGFLACDRTGPVNRYLPIITENDYRAGASGSFLSRLYHNSVRSLVATLYDNEMISETDIRELREYLDQLERDKND